MEKGNGRRNTVIHFYKKIVLSVTLYLSDDRIYMYFWHAKKQTLGERLHGTVPCLRRSMTVMPVSMIRL